MIQKKTEEIHWELLDLATKTRSIRRHHYMKRTQDSF